MVGDLYKCLLRTRSHDTWSCETIHGWHLKMPMRAVKQLVMTPVVALNEYEVAAGRMEAAERQAAKRQAAERQAAERQVAPMARGG